MAMMLWMYFAGASRVPVPNIQLPAPSQPPRPIATSPAQDHRAPEHTNSPSTSVTKTTAEGSQEAPGSSSASVAAGQASLPSTPEKVKAKREQTEVSKSNGPRFRERATLKGHAAAVNCIAFCSNKNELLSASTDSTLRLWHGLDGKGEAILATYDHVGFSVAVSPDGTTIASGIGDKTVGLWDRKTLREQLLDGHTDIVTSVAFSPDGRLLASGSAGGTVKLWSTSDARLQRTLTLPYLTAMSLAFSADSRLLAGSAGGNALMIWDVASGRQRAVLSGHSAPDHESGLLSGWPNHRFSKCGQDSEAMGCRLRRAESNVHGTLKGSVRGRLFTEWQADCIRRRGSHRARLGCGCETGDRHAGRPF